MEEKNEKIAKREENQPKKIKKKKSNLKKVLAFLVVGVIAVVVIITLIPKGERKIEMKIKSSLTKIIEKSDLETINITYNVIAKQCKEDGCDTTSNKIGNFKYVVSCKGTITAGIDFSNVKIDVDEENKKIIIEVPEAVIKGEPNIGSIKFLNGNNVSADELPNARKLCQEVTKAKSQEDDQLIPKAKDQAIIVLEEFYSQWIKAYDSSYTVEVK